jgi:DNA-binding response OmpR family regulator
MTSSGAPIPNRSADYVSVLVIDDDDDIADSMADVLRLGGYRVEVARSGLQAIEVVEQIPVGIVLLDWRMPEEPQGTKLVRRLREILGSTVPIIVLSADTRALTEARQAEVTDYLPKPFEIEDLLHVVDEHYAGPPLREVLPRRL